MKTEKKWTKVKDNDFEFVIENEKHGTFSLDWKNLKGKADFIIKDEKYYIQRKSFWKAKVEITDVKGKSVLEMSSKKWYSNNWIITYQSKVYILKVINNPLVEYSIWADGQKLMSYGLSIEKNKVSTKITNYTDTPLLFDFLLWYLFMPIATGSDADDDFLVSMVV